MDGQLRFMSHVADTLSAGAILGAMGHFLPPLAALVGIIWYAIQIYESKTFQRFLARVFKRPPEDKPGDRIF
jgi:hypothetical protein